jgi:hypothetical protein
MAPGAVPVIHFSDDESDNHRMNGTPMDILDDQDEFEGDYDFNRMHKGSTSSNNYDNLFGHHDGHYHKDHDDSESASRNSDKHVDHNSNAENEFKILMYLEDKNEMNEDSQDSDNSYSNAKGVQIEKKLDGLFKQEVPLTNIYYDSSGKEIVTIVKPGSSDQAGPYYPIEGGII